MYFKILTKLEYILIISTTREFCTQVNKTLRTFKIQLLMSTCCENVYRWELLDQGPKEDNTSSLHSNLF